jgi:TPR repeat protein
MVLLVLGYRWEMKKKLFAVLGFVLLSAGAWEIATAQTDQNQRRKAFQASKQMQSLGDFADAVEVLQPLADAGDELAIYSIGLLYATGGDDLKQDYAKAITYYQKGADKQHAGSMRQLGVMFDKGWGVAANPTQASQWYENAAKRGDALAQLIVGRMYATGQGRSKSSTEAYKWLTLAQAGVFFDDEAAKRDETKGALKTLVAQMTPGDINSGEKMVREFAVK